MVSKPCLDWYSFAQFCSNHWEKIEIYVTKWGIPKKKNIINHNEKTTITFAMNFFHYIVMRLGKEKVKLGGFPSFKKQISKNMNSFFPWAHGNFFPYVTTAENFTWHFLTICFFWEGNILKYNFLLVYFVGKLFTLYFPFPFNLTTALHLGCDCV